MFIFVNQAAIEEYAVFLDVPPLPSIVESTTSGGNNTAELIPSDDENVEWQNETTTTPKTASAMPDVTAFKPTARLAIGVQSSEFETLDASVFASVADRVCYAGFFAPLRMTLMPNLSNMTALREIVVEVTSPGLLVANMVLHDFNALHTGRDASDIAGRRAHA